MIINKQGEKCLCSNGVEYIIGEEVIGTENGDYEGLIGRIYEIRTVSYTHLDVYKRQAYDHRTGKYYCKMVDSEDTSTWIHTLLRKC